MSMTKDIQFKRIGVEIDTDVWEEFRTYVKENNKGRIKNFLSAELETALEFYMAHAGSSNRQSRFIEDDDNGGHKSEDQPHTHNHTDIATKTAGDSVSYIAKMPEKYSGVLAKLYGNYAMPRKDLYGILTRELDITSDKSRLEHVRTLEYQGIISPMKDRDDAFEIHQDVIDSSGYFRD